MESLDLEKLRNLLDKLYIPWKEEVSPGVWRIGNKSPHLWTTDTGAKQFDEILEEEFKRVRDDFSNNIKGLDELPGDKSDNSGTGVS